MSQTILIQIALNLDIPKYKLFFCSGQNVLKILKASIEKMLEMI